MSNKRVLKKKEKSVFTADQAANKKVVEKTDTDVKFYVQYQDKEYLECEIVKQIKSKLEEQGNKAEEIKELCVYLKPEDNKAYYTADGTISGAVDL